MGLTRSNAEGRARAVTLPQPTAGANDVWWRRLREETSNLEDAIKQVLIMADEELPFAIAEQEGSGLQFAAGYTFSESIRMTGGYQRFEFDGPINNCFTDAGGFGCDTLDGNVGYLETTFSF